MRALLVLSLIVALCFLGGCANMTQSSADARATCARTFKYDMRQIGDDFNSLWLLDRPSRLSRWVMR